MVKIIKRCKNCKLEFNSYSGHNRIYCSKKCYSIFMEGKPFPKRENPKETRKRMIGSKNPMWKGGIIGTGKGHKLMKVLNHPFANKKGYMLEHRLVVEKYLGRYLKPIEVVHHIDGQRDNNNIENLHLFQNQSEHISYHHFLQSLVRGEINA